MQNITALRSGNLPAAGTSSIVGDELLCQRMLLLSVCCVSEAKKTEKV